MPAHRESQDKACYSPLAKTLFVLSYKRKYIVSICQQELKTDLQTAWTFKLDTKTIYLSMKKKSLLVLCNQDLIADLSFLPAAYLIPCDCTT